jgi:protein O-GlcNAc transferase
MNRHERRAKQKTANKSYVPQGDAITHAMKTAYQYQMGGRLEEAERIYAEVVRIHPNHADALCLLGIVKDMRGAPMKEALPYIDRALEQDDSNHLFHYHRGLILLDNFVLEQAISAMKRCAELNPSFASAYLGLGMLYSRQKRHDEAIEAYEKALSYIPDNALGCNNLAGLYRDLGKIDKSIMYQRRSILGKDKNNPVFQSNLLFTLNYDPSQTTESLLAAHKEWNRHYALPLAHTIQPHTNNANPDRQLKIGYVSADFRNHPVGNFLFPALYFHNRKQFKVYCYSNVEKEDWVTRIIKQQVDSWQSVLGMSDEATADQIRADGIDILVDLSGHTGGNRLLVFARKPAPIQVSWIGYFNTTGMDTMDYFISDNVHIPPGHEGGFTEEIVRLPDAYIAYAPRLNIREDKKEQEPDTSNHKIFAGYDIQSVQEGIALFYQDFLNKLWGLVGLSRTSIAEAIKTVPVLRTGSITFGSFNYLAKLNDDVIILWAEILQKVPGSRLILKGAVFGSEKFCDEFRARCAVLGIDKDRLELRKWSTIKDLYSEYNDIDIALDPFPFNGGATTCDALWMGVPVVTLAGEHAVSRQSATYLTQIGMKELIAQTKEAYVEIVLGLVNDLDRLSSLRTNLRRRMLQSPLCDAPRFAKNLESAYREMWHKWCAKQTNDKTKD